MDKLNSLTLSEFVKEKRKKIGLTQHGLAEKAGVGLRFVRELENNKPSMQMDKVNQVLLLFGYTLGPVPLNREKLFHENS